MCESSLQNNKHLNCECAKSKNRPSFACKSDVILKLTLLEPEKKLQNAYILDSYYFNNAASLFAYYGLIKQTSINTEY